MEIAHYNKRVLAYLVDFLFTYGIGAGLSSLLFIYTSIPWYFSLIISAVICYFTYLLFNIPIMTFSKGKTIGATIFGIKTVSKENKPISARNVWIKQLYLGLIPFVIANAVYMLVIHTEQTIFDRITDTIVIESRGTVLSTPNSSENNSNSN